MTTPIQRRVGMVFIPVSDMARAVRFYRALFDLPAAETAHAGKIYDLRWRARSA